ncbi:peptidase inhibitor family I36 protein [Amycolatopsis sp. FU40]|uniref:peptidase inhibitor family I36 protein n=1 Tax=Amycolatopsis sp. FU40 TaxID=2914159 RepID=UPI001F178E18|nr:peptidase inhibitor family I36 protein [Amycolatopsis sp. FU40]UKD59171.1 peptidase inhibitor family I36 protein [Amycolatopsis sp. FU40]
MTLRRAGAFTAVLTLGAATVVTGTASAAATGQAAARCPSGAFCVWTQANFAGERFVFTGDDHEWEAGLAKHDASWVNHAHSGPGVKDHVKVFAGDNLTGRTTICLAPGQAVSMNKEASHRGSSHTFTTDC